MVLRLVFCQKKTFQAHYVENNKKTSFVTSKSMDMGKKNLIQKGSNTNAKVYYLPSVLKIPHKKLLQEDNSAEFIFVCFSRWSFN